MKQYKAFPMLLLVLVSQNSFANSDGYNHLKELDHKKNDQLIGDMQKDIYPAENVKNSDSGYIYKATDYETYRDENRGLYQSVDINGNYVKRISNNQVYLDDDMVIPALNKSYLGNSNLSLKSWENGGYVTDTTRMTSYSFMGKYDYGGNEFLPESNKKVNIGGGTYFNNQRMPFYKNINFKEFLKNNPDPSALFNVHSPSAGREKSNFKGQYYNADKTIEKEDSQGYEQGVNGTNSFFSAMRFIPSMFMFSSPENGCDAIIDARAGSTGGLNISSSSGVALQCKTNAQAKLKFSYRYQGGVKVVYSPLFKDEPTANDDYSGAHYTFMQSFADTQKFKPFERVKVCVTIDYKVDNQSCLADLKVPQRVEDDFKNAIKKFDDHRDYSPRILKNLKYAYKRWLLNRERKHVTYTWMGF
ncbi:hypothetical protein [Photobacterium leiognathi]|uniref:hypothetical protein n=1 Tax=Photobacterium leiognathi TaxID=553611 RepID=UPI0029824685|nr:hypothetical protein [Photobacterium leiognathi]